MEKTINTLHNPEVSEIMSTPPGWLIRYGILVFTAVLISILVLSWLIRYPDLVTGRLTIVAETLPKSLVTRSDGRITKLYVQDGAVVRKGQILVQMETIANYNEVIELSALVDNVLSKIVEKDIVKIYNYNIPQYKQLGELQKPYQVFQDILINTKYYIPGERAFDKLSIMHGDLIHLDSLRIHLKNQLDDVKEDFKLSTKDLDVGKLLLRDRVISDADYRQIFSKFLAKKQAVESWHSQIENVVLSENQKKQDIIEHERLIDEHQRRLTQAIRTLKSDIDTWKSKYQIISPVDSKLIFRHRIQENQDVKSGEVLFNVIENSVLGIVGDLRLSQSNLGKVKIGQTVLVKPSSYPYQKFGILSGVLISISDLPQDSMYNAQVAFPNGLKTSNNHQIPFRNGLTADAQIITEDKSLLEQLLQDFIIFSSR